MARDRDRRRRADGGVASEDEALLALLQRDPRQAWEQFLDKHAAPMLAHLRWLGMDADLAADCFLSICQKLCVDDFRRLRRIRYTGRDGEITPWLRTVTRNLAVNWLQSRHGRPRMLRAIAELSELDQRVFERYFWRAEMPAEIYERLRCQSHPDLRLADVLDAIDRIFVCLSEKKIWRLVSNLMRRAKPGSLSELDEADMATSGRGAAGPEEALLRREASARLAAARGRLGTLERLSLQLRYEDGLPVRRVAEMLGVDRDHAKVILARARRRLRRLLDRSELSVG